MPEKATREDIRADIQRVADELGAVPTREEYRDRGEWSARTAANRFGGSFTAARAAALDVPDERLPKIRRDEYLADIRRVAGVVDGEPSKDDYHEHGEYALSGIMYRFNSGIEGKKEAGVYEGPTREALITDMQRVDADIDEGLSQKRYNELGEWSTRPVKRRFTSWEAACQQADVSRPDMGPRSADTGDLLNDIRNVAEKIGHVPSRSEYHEYGQYSRQMAISRIGSWPDAVRKAGFEPRDSGGQSGELNPNWEGGYEPYYGANWYEKRQAARERDGYECVACGMSDKEHGEKYGWELEVHHITPIREFENPENANTLENLITLCRPHHRQYESLPTERAKK